MRESKREKPRERNTDKQRESERSQRDRERSQRESERSQRESERQGRERLIDTVRHTRRSRGRHLERGRRGGARNCSYVRGRYSTQGRSAERGPGDLDDEYMALVNDGEWVEVTRGRNKNKLLNRTHPHPINQHRATIKGSWRDKADVTTFYFSRFPTWVNEKDLWQTFQRWGKVWEVFIPKYKNREGQRFGFVRYKDVHDVERLERKLDNNIFFGRTKMFVNQPKFQRSKEASQKQKTNAGNGNLRVEGRGSQGGSKVIASGGRVRSYAEVVKQLSPGKTKQCHQKPESFHPTHDVQRPVVLESSKL